MNTSELEKRLAAVEGEIARLKQRVAPTPNGPNEWLEKIAGSFSDPEDRAALDEATRLGRKWRKAQNRRSTKGRKGMRK